MPCSWVREVNAGGGRSYYSRAQHRLLMRCSLLPRSRESPWWQRDVDYGDFHPEPTEDAQEPARRGRTRRLPSQGNGLMMSTDASEENRRLKEVLRPESKA